MKERDDAHSGQIVASVLTRQDVDDPSQVGPLLEQIPQEIEQVTADGAYDGEPTYEVIAAHGEGIAVVIPPRVTSLQSAELSADATPRLAFNAIPRRNHTRSRQRQWLRKRIGPNAGRMRKCLN